MSVNAPGTVPDAPEAKGRGEWGSREFTFTPGDFDRVRRLIHEYAGIALSDVKQDMVYSRLARRLRALGDRTFADYLARLQRDREELERFVNSLTTNLTSFFREAHHFDHLRERIRQTGGRTFRIWCAAASTGEEPYSLAMTACEAAGSERPPVEIIASDIDTSVISEARRGVYRAERTERLSADRISRFFSPEPGVPGSLRARDELRRLIDFRVINLMSSSWGVPAGLDAIFCRNVMIYFDKSTQYAVLKRFAPLLGSDGLLYAGHSESFMHATDLFRSLGRTIYEPVRS